MLCAAARPLRLSICHPHTPHRTPLAPPPQRGRPSAPAAPRSQPKTWHHCPAPSFFGGVCRRASPRQSPYRRKPLLQHPPSRAQARSSSSPSARAGEGGNTRALGPPAFFVQQARETYNATRRPLRLLHSCMRSSSSIRSCRVKSSRSSTLSTGEACARPAMRQNILAARGGGPLAASTRHAAAGRAHLPRGGAAAASLRWARRGARGGAAAGAGARAAYAKHAAWEFGAALCDPARSSSLSPAGCARQCHRYKAAITP